MLSTSLMERFEIWWSLAMAFCDMPDSANLMMSLTLIFWLIKKHLLSVDTGLSPKINLRGGDVVSFYERVVSFCEFCDFKRRFPHMN
jgi:hypothetical protein